MATLPNIFIIFRKPEPAEKTCKLSQVLKRTSDSNNSEWPASTPRNHIGYIPQSVLNQTLQGSIDFNCDAMLAKYKIAEEIVRSQWAPAEVDREMRHKAIDYWSIDKSARALGSGNAIFKLKPARSNRINQELLQIPCGSWCSGVGCSPGFYSFRTQVMIFGCFGLDWLNETARREYDAILARDISHDLKEPLRVHLPAPDNLGVVFWQRANPTPGVYGYCPETLGNATITHFAPYKDLGGLLLGDLRHQQKLHIMSFSKHFAHQQFLRPRVPNLTYPLKWNEKMRMSPDYFLVNNSLSVRDPIMYFETHDVAYPGHCPLCVGLVKVSLSTLGIIEHLMLKHGEYAVPGAKVICFACGDEAKIDDSAQSIFRHHKDYHESYEPFSHLTTPTGVAIRLKMASCAIVVAATAIRVAAVATRYQSIVVPAKVYNLGATADSHIRIKNGNETVKIKSARVLGSQDINLDPHRLGTLANKLRVAGPWADPARKGQTAWTLLHGPAPAPTSQGEPAQIVNPSPTPPEAQCLPPATVNPPPPMPPKAPSPSVNPPPPVPPKILSPAVNPPSLEPPRTPSPPPSSLASPPPPSPRSPLSPGEHSPSDSDRSRSRSGSRDRRSGPAQDDSLLNSDSDNVE